MKSEFVLSSIMLTERDSFHNGKLTKHPNAIAFASVGNAYRSAPATISNKRTSFLF